MSTSVYRLSKGTWTEEEYLALSETSVKVELFDGDLVMSPPANVQHQDMSFHLTQMLRRTAREAGLRVYQDIGVRLRPGRIAIPDVTVVEPVAPDVPVVEAALVRLVAEISSRGNRRNDRVRKLNYYAAAAIPQYLLVDRYPTLVLRLFQLKDDHYIEQAAVTVGGVLRLTDPFDLDIDTAIFDE